MATNLPNFNVVTTRVKNNEISSLNIDGNLAVLGSISPGTFTNRVIPLVDLAGAGAVAASPLTAAQSGNIVVIPRLSGGTQTISLPPAAPGLTYTFVQSGTAGGSIFQILCDTAVAENIFGTVDNNATLLAIDAVQLQFLAASVLGNSVTLTAIGTGAGDVWAITKCAGFNCHCLVSLNTTILFY